MEPSLGLRRDIARVIRAHRPDLVICQNPERSYERIYASHPDHMATGEATLRAVLPRARNPHAFPELLARVLRPMRCQRCGSASSEPTMVVDITKSIDQKISALFAHVSQIGDAEGPRRSRTRLAKQTAKRAGLKKGRSAEAFKVVDTK